MTSEAQDVFPPIAFSTALYNGFMTRLIQTVFGFSKWYHRSLPSPSDAAPTLVKTYDCRPSLTVRVFFPSTWVQTGSQSLPCYLNIHGGGFCVGCPDDDDKWNRSFADTHNILVVELDYRKAPAHPFPTAVYDLEALIQAVYDDESLPIDNHRLAIGGFSAGGNLALAVSQLRSVRGKLSAACPIYPLVDQSIGSEAKVKTRYFKPDLGSGLRSHPTDLLSTVSVFFRWSYIPYGHSLKDPLLSPFFAPRGDLPRKIFIVAAELDRLAHEAWRMASVLAHRPEPPLNERVGQERPSAPEELILDDERFAFGHVDDGGREVQWLLVPDQIHGFDLEPLGFHGSEESFQDAQVKTKAYQNILGDWLHKSVWISRD
ncbi:Alpha/Beta hydrolase protein [Xylariales sp. AK1849]|nr:Alpha/Beta hydrolase protein [Xylariales sp. AK1849]